MHSVYSRIYFGLAIALTLTLTLSSNVGAANGEKTWSLLIKNGTIVDGTGARLFKADVAISKDRIVEVSRTPLDVGKAQRVIDANNLTVAPGFIDLHTHIEPIFEMPDAKSAVTQGVTFVLGGPDGGSPLPLGPHLAKLDRTPLGINVAYLVGHGTIRTQVMGTENRAPTPAELKKMQELVEEGMRDGAFGLSTGLLYVPGFYAQTDEIIALSRAAADLGGFYTSHLRDEGRKVMSGVEEAIRIGSEARIPVVLTHHKFIGQAMWGKSTETLKMVDEARKNGLDVMLDQYPYTASSTGLSVLIPQWALEGGIEAFRNRLKNADEKARIERGVVDLLANDRGGGDTKRVQFASVPWAKSLEGATLWDWAERRKISHTLEAAAQLVIEGYLKGNASMIYHVMSEEDVRRIMIHPQTMIASDGRLSRPGEGQSHPRSYGTFPRVLGKYVREQKLLTLESAVHKMTGMPAKRLGLQAERGKIAAGYFADVVVFDAKRINDEATFEKPHAYATGVFYVLVNGTLVIDNGQMTKARPGRVIRHIFRTGNVRNDR